MTIGRFSALFTLRLALIFLSLLLWVWVLLAPGLYATSVLLLMLVLLQCWELIRYVGRTNAELSRFFGAARFADFNQQFSLTTEGTGFAELGETFTDILSRIRNLRSDQERELRHLRALLEHVPVALMSVHGNGTVTLWNNAARRLFGSATVTSVDQLRQFGDGFAANIQNINVGERRLVRFSADGTEHLLTLAATQIIVSANTEKFISLQDIQSELDAAQLQAWQDLVRVLTHEIMNSITPVASLANTSTALVDDLESQLNDGQDVQEAMTDLKQALTTLSRRAENLINFVGSYRSLTRLPPPNKERIVVPNLFDHVSRIATQGWVEKGIQLHIQVTPKSLSLDADREMLEQVLINLLKNAEQALAKTSKPKVWMSASLNKRGRVFVQVADNGPGVSAAIAENVFVPFFTTKAEGSGVGLALSRQVMIAHGGTIKLSQQEDGGALFTLNF